MTDSFITQAEALIESTEIRLETGRNPSGSQVYIADDEDRMRDLATALRSLLGEYKRLTTELLEAHTHFAVQEGRLREAVTRAEKAEAVIERVRELHKPINRGAGGMKCSLCTTEDGFLELFPCFTIRALGGDQT